MTDAIERSSPGGPRRLAGILLAAGRARRFGSDKRLAPFDANDTLLTRSLRLIQAHCARVWVVLGPRDQPGQLLGPWLEHPDVEWLCAPNADQGMGSSLADAVRALVRADTAARVSGAMVMLADMPWVASATLAQLAAAHDAAAITFPALETVGGEPPWGHPVIFGRAWFDALAALHGEGGGRAIMRANPAARLEILVQDEGILLDIDRPSDLHRLTSDCLTRPHKEPVNE